MASPSRNHVSIFDKRGTKLVALPLVAVIAMLLVIVVMTILLWSIWRSSDTRLIVREPGDFQTMLPSIAGVTQGNIDKGNQVQLLENGDGFFPPLLADIAAARETIHIESYIWWKGEVCRQLANALAAKSKQGIEVRLMVDASGGHKMDKELEKLMVDAGVKLHRFHQIRLKNLARINNRDHRKIAVIDGRIGYIGGYGIAEEWTGHGQDKQHWRDTGVRVTGPVVARMQGAFCENWIEETGEVPAGPKYFPQLSATGSTPVHLAYTSPTGSVSSVQVLYYLAIKSARKQIIIQNPYMLPDSDAIEALTDAVKRGVDVRIMVPATQSTDSPIVQHASHHHFGDLLKKGVKIYEYKKTLLHQKVIIVDGVWSCVGSTNFDDRSFDLNDEISMGILDTNLANQLKAAYDNDMHECEERHFEEWRDRPLWHKMMDGLAYLANDEL
jgi:cardiolipin synthase